MPKIKKSIKSKINKKIKKDFNFKLVDVSTVDGIKKKIDTAKDLAWNEKLLNSKLLKGLLHGDSVDTIALDFLSVVNNNQASAMRNARTMITEAECSGRNDSYKALDEMGIVQKKVWIATPDERVRDEHLLMDGEEVDIDDVFSNGCAFPGDPAGDPETVYNCRCSIRDHIIGFMRDDGSVSYIDYERRETLHDKQIAQERKERS